MSEKFQQYDLIKTLSKKYSHATYLASPISDPKRQTVLTVFFASLFSSPLEHENLLQKARHLKKLQHECLASILDVGIEKEQPFVVREYLPKGSLRSRLRKLSPDRLKLRDALTLILQVGEVLAYAHGQGFVHGNIKPENILFNANDQIVLSDFYLVGRKDAAIRDQASEEYAFCYMAPEQFAGITDAKSDQYALGCLAYELITGQTPFAIQSLASMMGQPSNATPAPLFEKVADLPPSLETAVLKTLAKDPDERFFDFSLFLEVIQTVLSPPPAFPLLRSTHAHKKRNIPHSVQSAQDVSFPISPIRKRATARTAPQPLEPSVASSSAKVDSAQDIPFPIAPIYKQAAEHTTSQSFELSTASSSTKVDSAQDIPFPVSPIYKQAAEHTTSQSFELSTASSSAKTDIAQSTNTALTSQISMLEWTGIIPVSESLEAALEGYQSPLSHSEDVDPIDDRENEKDAGDLLVADALVQEKADTANEETLSLIKSPDIGRSQPVRTLSKRIKVLGLAILLAVFVFVVISSSWLPRISTPDTSSRTAQTIIRVATVQIKNMPTPSIQTTNRPTVQASAQTTSIPTTQSPSPMPTSAVKPTSIPKPKTTPAKNYQADASQNTLANGAKVVGCSECSNGDRVGYIGLNAGEAGTLQFNNVTKNVAGMYQLTIYYIIAGSDKLTIYISTNGGSAVALNVPDMPNGDTVGTASISISLNAGNNTIKFSNPSNPAPDMDRIIV